jgi:hypothetical protein
MCEPGEGLFPARDTHICFGRSRSIEGVGSMFHNRMLASCLFVVLGAIPAMAQQKSEIPTVSTTGRGEIKVVPDLADLNFQVDVRGPVLRETLAKQAAKMGKLLSVLKAAGIKDVDLQTTQVIIQPNYKREDMGHSETDVIAFYSVSQSVFCTLDNIGRITKLTEAAIEAGATGVGSVNLRSSKLRQHRDEARLLAVRAAKEKAKVLAEELGAKVGKPQTIVESASDVMPYYNIQASNMARMAEMGGGGGSSPEFEAGTIKITAEVSVSFVLE